MNIEWTVTNNIALQQFEVRIGDQVAVLNYVKEGKHVTFIHTGVPQTMEGNGIGSAIAHAALAYAKTERLEVVPLCPFVRGYIEKHPEYRTLVSRDYQDL
ncbi:MAG: N-acetyltransferase [Chloroflexi bacterium]|nr:N-acetyltransferase [Chloroflexota bacterium]